MAITDISPESFLVYVLKIGEPSYARYTEPFLREYCRRHGYRLEIGGQAARGRHPAWQKLLVHRWVRAEFVLLVDLDIVPLPGAPPIHEVLDPRRLNMVCIPPSKWGAAHCLRRGMDPALMKYNTGLLGFPRSYAPWMERIHAEADVRLEVFMEQGHVNQAIARDNVQVHELEPRWNFCVQQKYTLVEAAWQAHFLHFAGNHCWRLQRSHWLWKHYCTSQTGRRRKWRRGDRMPVDAFSPSPF